jgi:tetratricopeptide (TPR) repeat protein
MTPPINDIPVVEQMGPRAAVMGPRAAVEEQMGPRAAVMGPRAAVECSVNSGATFLLAYFLYKNAQVDASLKLIVQIESRNPQNPLTAWLRALICHYHTHEFDQAVSLYLTAIRRSPDFAYPYYSLGTLLNECGPGYILYANLLYSKCMQIDPNNHCALLNTAVIESNNIKKISTLYRVIAIYPTETYTWHVLIRAILSRKPLLESDKIEVLELQKKLNKVIEY